MHLVHRSDGARLKRLGRRGRAVDLREQPFFISISLNIKRDIARLRLAFIDGAYAEPCMIADNRVGWCVGK